MPPLYSSVFTYNPPNAVGAVPENIVKSTVTVFELNILDEYPSVDLLNLTRKIVEFISISYVWVLNRYYYLVCPTCFIFISGKMHNCVRSVTFYLVNSRPLGVTR